MFLTISILIINIHIFITNLAKSSYFKTYKIYYILYYSILTDYDIILLFYYRFNIIFLLCFYMSVFF